MDDEALFVHRPPRKCANVSACIIQPIISGSKRVEKGERLRELDDPIQPVVVVGVLWVGRVPERRRFCDDGIAYPIRSDVVIPRTGVRVLDELATEIGREHYDIPGLDGAASIFDDDRASVVALKDDPGARTGIERVVRIATQRAFFEDEGTFVVKVPVTRTSEESAVGGDTRTRVPNYPAASLGTDRVRVDDVHVGE